MNLSDILNNPKNASKLPIVASTSSLRSDQPQNVLFNDQASRPAMDELKLTEAREMVTGNGDNIKNTAPNHTADLPILSSSYKAPIQPSQPREGRSILLSTSLPAESVDKMGKNTELYPHPTSIPSVLPPVPQQNSRIRVRSDSDESFQNAPQKRVRRYTNSDSSSNPTEYSVSSGVDMPSSSSRQTWAASPNPVASTSALQSKPRLVSEDTVILDDHGRPIVSTPETSWQGTTTRSNSLPYLPPPPSRTSTSKFPILNSGRDNLSKGRSLYPEPTLASISSAGSSAWHESMNGSYMSSYAPPLPQQPRSILKDVKSENTTDPFARPVVPHSSPSRSASSLPPFRRRGTSATELLEHPQIKAALHRHKELSWKATQEQVGGVWEPKKEVKVMVGDGAPASLMKRYSVNEILEPSNWHRDEDVEEGSPHRVWFQIRPAMEGSTKVSEEENVEESSNPYHSTKDSQFSASKELMINQLFPKYEPYISGLPPGEIYLRHDHDRFEFRPKGWGKTLSELPENPIPKKTDGDSRALVIRTPGGSLRRRREVPPENRRLLQWSLAQARWLFVFNEMPTAERPEQEGGYPTPDRDGGFLNQGDIVRRLDADPDNPGWEWILPIRRKLWISPMEDIVKKTGSIAEPLWDLGGRMLWDTQVGQWRFEVCPAIQEVTEIVAGEDGVEQTITYDVCVGGRPRISPADFTETRNYLLNLQRKLTKLKTKARERSLAPSIESIKQEDRIKKEEEDSDAEMLDVKQDPDETVVQTHPEIAEKGQKYKSLTEHGQRCAASLLNMMMSAGNVAPTVLEKSKDNTRRITATGSLLFENSMDLDAGASSKATWERPQLPSPAVSPRGSPSRDYNYASPAGTASTKDGPILTPASTPPVVLEP